MQTRFHTLAPCSQRGHHTPSLPNMTAWYHATPLLLHSYIFTQIQTWLQYHKQIGHWHELSDRSDSPEKQNKSLEKSPEVVMLVDGAVSVLLNCNVPKQLWDMQIHLNISVITGCSIFPTVCFKTNSHLCEKTPVCGTEIKKASAPIIPACQWWHRWRTA